jgi:hypothetical protein
MNFSTINNYGMCLRGSDVIYDVCGRDHRKPYVFFLSKYIRSVGITPRGGMVDWAAFRVLNHNTLTHCSW